MNITRRVDSGLCQMESHGRNKAGALGTGGFHRGPPAGTGGTKCRAQRQQAAAGPQRGRTEKQSSTLQTT